MAGAPSALKTFGMVTAMLFLGSHNTVSTKLQLQTCAPSFDPVAQTDKRGSCPLGQMQYQSAWLNNMYMFIGESTLILAYGILRRRSARAVQCSAGAGQASMDQGLLAAPANKPSLFVFAIPAFCDVLGTGLATVGMLYMDPAIWQMLRSSIIIFTAVLSVTFLKRRLQPFHWVATGIVLVALLMVGYASLLDGSATTNVEPSKRMLGIGLTVGAQLLAAFQMVFEEKLVGHTNTSAKKVVGMEGCWGILYMLILLPIFTMVPGSDYGSYENTPIGLYKTAHSPMLLTLVIFYMFSIALYNFVGLAIAKHLSSVVRCLVDSLRTVVVWAVNLFIYYFISKEYGSAWEEHSWITMLGFGILIFGTLMYNDVLPIPDCLRLPEGAENEDLGERVVSGLDEVLTKSRVGVDEDEEDLAPAAVARVAGDAI